MRFFDVTPRSLADRQIGLHRESIDLVEPVPIKVVPAIGSRSVYPLAFSGIEAVTLLQLLLSPRTSDNHLVDIRFLELVEISLHQASRRRLERGEEIRSYKVDDTALWFLDI